MPSTPPLYAYLRAATLPGAAGAAIATIADSSGANRPATATNATLSVVGSLRGITLNGSTSLDLGADPTGLNALCRDGDYTVVVAVKLDSTGGAGSASEGSTAGTLFAKNPAANGTQSWVYAESVASNSNTFAHLKVGRYGSPAFYTGAFAPAETVVFARRIQRVDATHITETHFINGVRRARVTTDTSAMP